MLRGLYVSASGMMADTTRLDVVANNLANAATTGYKRDTLTVTAFADLLVSRLDERTPDARRMASPAVVGPLGLGVEVGQTATRLTDGPLHHTGRDLDVAIQGDGLFTVATQRGIRYTRQGNFQRDAQGRLVTAAGDPVLVNGEPVGRPGAELTILASGEVLLDGVAAGRLDIAPTAELGPLRKEGDNLWAVTAGAGQLLPPVVQADEAGAPYRLQVQFLEAANVQPVLEMVDLITAMRGYEANQKAIHAQDETLSRAVNDIGRL